MRTQVIASALAAAGMLALSGCGSIADPNTSEFGLHYSGGAFSSQAFEYCIPPGTRNVGGAGDFDYYLPAGTRTYSFGTGTGADAGPVSVATKNKVELGGGATITFHVNQDCTPWTDPQGHKWDGGRPQKLFDTILRQHGAFNTGSDDPVPDSWKSQVLDVYLKSAADRAMDFSGQEFNYEDLYGNPAVKALWVTEIKRLFPQYLNDQMGGDLFIIDSIQVDQPYVPDQIRDQYVGNEAAKLSKTTADTNRDTAATFPGGLQGYLDYQQKLAVNKAIADGKVQILPIPYGSPVIVGH